MHNIPGEGKNSILRGLRQRVFCSIQKIINIVLYCDEKTSSDNLGK
jgi:hypothetical protein